MNEVFRNQFENISLLVKNYKCFGEDEQGFNKICPINIIIGRNNSGKSALLEVIKYATNPYQDFTEVKHKGKDPEVYITQPVPDTALRSIFPENTSGGDIPGRNHWEYAFKWVGSTLKCRLLPDKKLDFINLEPPFQHTQSVGVHQKQLAERIPNPFAQMTFKHLRAERNITSETHNAPPKITENGEGTTNMIQYFINQKGMPSELVEETILKALNEIYEPDSSFSRILVQIDPNSKWEVYLDELNKGHIPLSHTGSGFKTILLVLGLLYLIPHNENNSLQHYIFAFEELENNLHPALQRRLLKYLRDFTLQNGCYVFITTHSSVIIDLFSRDDKAQILHVTHDGVKATVKYIQTYIQNKGILDDLDVRASDLLQANSIIWIEGPSDRSYINRWIELWTDGELKEGVHYQCMFYAGRLLAHISAEDPETEHQNAISILRLNKNAVILIDSDKQKEEEELNDTKTRIFKEIQNMDGVAWVTKGREIENYIPSKVISKYYGKSNLPQLNEFDDFAKYLNGNIGDGEGKKFEKEKAVFAANISSMLTKDDITSVLDLSERLTEICNKIREWNRLPVQTAQ